MPTEDQAMKTILAGMRNDEITEVVANDSPILDFGSSLCDKLGTARTNDISQRVRQLARLLNELRKLPAGRLPRSTLEEYLKPERFDDVVAAVKSLCLFEEKSGESKDGTPSLALKLGYSLKKCIYIMWGKAVRNKDKQREDDAVNLEKLFEREWGDRVSHHSLSTLSQKKFNKSEVLPLTSDLKKIRDHLEEKMRKYSTILRQKPTKDEWKSMAEATLNRVVLFNKRRGGEASRLLLSDYNNRPAWNQQNNDEVFASLDPFEKELCERMDMVETIGNKGRKVPVLLTPEIKKAIDLLITTRNAVGVYKTNPYVFARPYKKSEGCLRASDCLRKVTRELDLTHPEAVTSTKLRKHFRPRTESEEDGDRSEEDERQDERKGGRESKRDKTGTLMPNENAEENHS